MLLNGLQAFSVPNELVSQSEMDDPSVATVLQEDLHQLAMI